MTFVMQPAPRDTFAASALGTLRFMDEPTSTVAQASATAHLAIHLEGVREDGAGWGVESWMQRMRAHCLRGVKQEQQAELSVEVSDLQGQRVLALSDAGSQVQIDLPAGTYHVATEWRGARRRYTVALQPGGSLDLHLRPARGHTLSLRHRAA